MKMNSLYRKFPVTTDRIKIKPLSKSMTKWYINEIRREYFTEFSDNKAVKDLSTLELYGKLLSLISTYRLAIQFIYEYRTVVYDINNNPIGGVTLFPLSNKTIELGYWIVPEEQNKGYGEEALRAITNHIFHIFKPSELKSIELCIQSYNIRSLKLAVKCGFKLCDEVPGSMCPNLIYRIDRELVES